MNPRINIRMDSFFPARIGNDLLLLKMPSTIAINRMAAVRYPNGDANLFNQKLYKLIIDMSGINYISSAGAGVLSASFDLCMKKCLVTTFRDYLHHVI